MGGKPKKKDKEEDKSEEDAAKLEAERAERLEKLRQLEEERQQKWEEAWDRKLHKEKRLEDCKACCAPDDFYPNPRTQSNIWLQVNHEKNTQHVQMSFMNVPVAKPKPPVLPKLKIIDVQEEEKGADSEPITDKKKGGKKKKK